MNVNDVRVAIQTIVAEDIASLTLTRQGVAGGDLTGTYRSSRVQLSGNRNDEIGDSWEIQYAR